MVKNTQCNPDCLQVYNPPASAFPSAEIQVSALGQANDTFLCLIYLLNIYLLLVCVDVYTP